VSISVPRSSNIVLAVLAGFVAAIAAAAIWGAISAATSFQIGYMAIGVGLVVAYAVRYAGQGHDPRFAYISAGLSLFGCVLGNYFAVCGMVANHEHANVVLAAVALLPHVAEVMKDSFHPMDLFFYALGTYFGYKYALVPLRVRPATAPPAPPPDSTQAAQ
jgi:hypothetical protein